ncbi:MAG: hypothetical protein NTY22_02325, partial [Proteobacteria bacterium]|nr:hypothetical protein [Pseudomonadota bacterium]
IDEEIKADEAIVVDDKDMGVSTETSKKKINKLLKTQKIEEDETSDNPSASSATPDTAAPPADAVPGSDEYKDEINKIRER